MCIITSNLNSTFGMIGKATGIKMTAKAVSQNLSFRVSMKSNLDMRFMQWSTSAKFEQFFAFK